MISIREEILSLNARNRIDNLPRGKRSQFLRDAIEFYVEYLTSNTVMTKDAFEEIEKLKKEVAEIRCARMTESAQVQDQEAKDLEKTTVEELEKEEVQSEEIQQEHIDSEEENLKRLLIESIISFVNDGEDRGKVNDRCCG